MIFAFFGGLANASSVMIGKQAGAGYLKAVSYTHLKPPLCFFALACAALAQDSGAAKRMKS